ncbi:MAG TPA: peptidoglycan-binding protein [Buttiauxella sp.]|nr:peptidoglycan-binding protein [Buttiauxella sp.]
MGSVKISGGYEFSQFRLISDWIVNPLWSGEVALLYGNKGVGKSSLIYKFRKSKSSVVFVFNAIKIDNNIHLMSTEKYEREHLTYSQDHFWLDVFPSINNKATESIIVIDNADLLARDIDHFTQTFKQLAPAVEGGVKLLLVGSPMLKNCKGINKRLPMHFHLSPLSEAECSDFLNVMQAEGQVGEGVIFRQSFVRHINNATKGNLSVMKRIAVIAKQLALAEQSTHLSTRQEKLVMAAAGLPFKSGPGGLLLATYVALALSIGWGGFNVMKLPFPAPHWLDVTKPVVKNAEPIKINAMASNMQDAMQQLFAIWGYEVSAEDAWCEQADRAGLVCESGNETLENLARYSLPWIARLNVENHALYAVIMRISDNELDLIINKQTWTVSRKWFDAHSEGHYTLMWPSAPDGKNRVTNKSAAESIIWLDAMLSRALGVPTNESGDWTPMLTEKVKLFQRHENLQQDGTPGKDTLIRLRQTLGEAPRLINEMMNTLPIQKSVPDIDVTNDVKKENAK